MRTPGYVATLPQWSYREFSTRKQRLIASMGQDGFSVETSSLG
jgi:hypothetical protein